MADGSNAEAVLSWLSLLGRCFLQTSQLLSDTLQQRSIASATTSRPQQARDRARVGKSMRSMCDLGGLILPQSVMRLALLLAAASGRTQQQLPQQKPVQLAALGKEPFRYEEVDKALAVSPQKQQLLQGVGMLLAQHCSSKGLASGLAVMQDSICALAEAAAASSTRLPSRGGMECSDLIWA